MKMAGSESILCLLKTSWLTGQRRLVSYQPYILALAIKPNSNEMQIMQMIVPIFYIIYGFSFKMRNKLSFVKETFLCI